MTTPLRGRGRSSRGAGPSGWLRRLRIVGVALVAIVGGTLVAIPGSLQAGRDPPTSAVTPRTSVTQKMVTKRTCQRRTVSPAYVAAVARATASRRDVWGEELLSSPGGPTYEAARRYLPPVLYGQQRQYRPLTPSGVYYLAFAYPLSARSRPQYALHVADGSQIITRRIGPWSPSLTIKVGPHGRERYGACVAWLVRSGRSIRVRVVPPPRPVSQLRLRLPAGERLGTVRVAGSTVRFDRTSGTIGLSGRRAPVDLVATVLGRPSS